MYTATPRISTLLCGVLHDGKPVLLRLVDCRQIRDLHEGVRPAIGPHEEVPDELQPIIRMGRVWVRRLQRRTQKFNELGVRCFRKRAQYITEPMRC